MFKRDVFQKFGIFFKQIIYLFLNKVTGLFYLSKILETGYNYLDVFKRRLDIYFNSYI